eukprot:5276427-Prymnesium_polylepis.3
MIGRVIAATHRYGRLICSRRRCSDRRGAHNACGRALEILRRHKRPAKQLVGRSRAGMSRLHDVEALLPSRPYCGWARRVAFESVLARVLSAPAHGADRLMGRVRPLDGE